METRALVALALSLLVFILWGVFMAKMQPPPEPQESAATQAESAAAPESPARPAQESSPTEPPDGEPATDAVDASAALPPQSEVTVTIRNGDYTYVFSSHGGVLKEIRAEKYKDDAGVPLNLVPHRDHSLYPLSLVSGDAELDRLLQTRNYVPSATALTLDASNPEQALSFQLEDPSGLKVKREYRFRFNKRLVETRTRIQAPQLAQAHPEYSVVWGPGLGGASKSQTDYFAFSGPTTFVNNERMENPSKDLNGKVTFQGDLKWTAFQNKYFAAALVPGEGIKSAFVKKVGTEDIYIGLNLESVQGAASADHMIYVGTKELEVLEESGYKLVRLIDYGWLGNKFAFLVKPMLKALNFFYGLTGNYGWAIIFLTFLIKMILFPLTHKSFKSMKGMQKVQPYIKVIQERNKDDRQKMNEEMMDLYRKHKVNPLGGCLPMILQIPVFISLYHALFFSIELRGAPFMLWIHDLSQSDPYYVTPVVMGATMFLQQKLTPSTVVDPIQQKIFLMMPLVFTFLFITFPAGLVIYWTVNNLLTIAQQYYIYHIAKD